ncbi:MAG: polyprenyl synthetase family protein [Phycisphaerales bacterium]
MTTALVDILPAHTGVAHEVRRGLVRVVERFERQLDSRLEPVNELCRYIERYRGKMLRPMLVLVSGMASGLREVNEAHITIGAVIEMIHVATLVHDDVLDDAEVRRGSATVNHMHGTEVSVILGDYLISKSFHLCSQLDTQAAALRVGEVTSRVCEGELLRQRTG